MKKHKIGSKVLNALLVASLCGTALPSAVFAASNDLTSTNQVPNVTQKTDTSDQVVVVYKKAKKDNIKDTSLKKSDVSQATTVSKQVDVVTPAKGESVDTLKNKLKKDDNVAGVCQNAKVKLSALPNDVSGGDSKSESEASYKLVQADQTWDQVPSGSKKIKVAVIDGGISTTSDDLKDRVETPISEISSGEKAGSPDHGTEVASIIAAEADNNKGIAGFSGKYDVSIVPYVCAGSSDSKGSYIDMDAILASLSDIATKKEASVINMSFALQKDAYHSEGETDAESKAADANYEEAKTTLQNAINKCVNNGVVAVAAAGNKNDNKVGEEVLPADLDNVISVGATDSTGATASLNFNDNADIFAPGENLSVIDSSGEATTDSGTSFSSPIVAANVAELMSAKLPNGKYADAKEASTAVTKTSVDTVKDKRLASFATSYAYLESDNQGDTTVKTNDITFSYDEDAINKLAQSVIPSGETFKYQISPVKTQKTVGEKLGSLPTLTVESPEGYTITGDWVDADGNKISADTVVPDAESTTYTLKNVKITKNITDDQTAATTTVKVKYSDLQKAVEDAGVSADDLTYTVDDTTYSSDATITVPLKDGKISDIPYLSITTPSNLDITSTWKDADGNEMTEGQAPSASGYTLSDIEVSKLSDDPVSYNNVKFTVSDDAVKEAMTNAGITGVTLKYAVSTPEKRVAYGYPLDTLPTVNVTSPEGYTMTGTWVDQDGNPIDEYTMAPHENSTTYTLTKIKITKSSDSKDSNQPKDNYTTMYKVDTSDVEVPNGVTITASPEEVDGDKSPEAAGVKIVVSPDTYVVEGQWDTSVGGGVVNPSGGTDGSTIYTYKVSKITKKDSGTKDTDSKDTDGKDSGTTEPTKKQVTISFKKGNLNLPEGITFKDTTQSWTSGEKFDISKFPTISGKATSGSISNLKAWFVDEDGKEVTNQTVVPDKDATYTLHIAATGVPTAGYNIPIRYAVDVSGVTVPKDAAIKVSKDTDTLRIQTSDKSLDFSLPTIEVTPKDAYTVTGKWIGKVGDTEVEIDPKSLDTILEKFGSDPSVIEKSGVDLIYKVTSITKKAQQTDTVTFKCNVDDIRKAAGKLLTSNQTLQYKIDDKTYTGDAVIQMAVKDGKIDHVPYVEIVSPKGLTLQGVWKDAKGNVLTKDTKYSDTYVLSDITVQDESGTQSQSSDDSKKTSDQTSNASTSQGNNPNSQQSNNTSSNGQSEDTSPKTGVNGNVRWAIALAICLAATTSLVLKVFRMEKDSSSDEE